MAMYKSTPAYQAYVQAKSRGNPVIEDPEPKGIRTAERRIDIQPAEDEEDPDDGLSVKHVAHARYLCNLICKTDYLQIILFFAHLHQISIFENRKMIAGFFLTSLLYYLSQIITSGHNFILFLTCKSSAMAD